MITVVTGGSRLVPRYRVFLDDKEIPFLSGISASSEDDIPQVDVTSFGDSQRQFRRTPTPSFVRVRLELLIPAEEVRIAPEPPAPGSQGGRPVVGSGEPFSRRILWRASEAL